MTLPAAIKDYDKSIEKVGVRMRQGKLVERVEAGSIAEELGIDGGDFVIAINGAEPADILDWQLAECDE